jgi:hypothetical protein
MAAAAGAVSLSMLGCGGDEPAAGFCTGPATEALIDDMSGAGIGLTPPTCGTKGAWTAFSSLTMTTPTGQSGPLLGACGSLCGSFYSPLPSGFPGTDATVDAGLPPRAVCLAGRSNGQPHYMGAGATLELAFSSPAMMQPPAWRCDLSGFSTDPPPALIDASQYSGIRFWLWVSPDTADAMGSSFEVNLFDRNELLGGGVCDSTSMKSTACGSANADISGSVAATAQGAGPLLGADGSAMTALAPGWQQIEAPWSSFRTVAGWGGANETVVDPKTLAFIQFQVQQQAADGGEIPFDFCIYALSFYP